MAVWILLFLCGLLVHTIWQARSRVKEREQVLAETREAIEQIEAEKRSLENASR